MQDTHEMRTACSPQECDTGCECWLANTDSNLHAPVVQQLLVHAKYRLNDDIDWRCSDRRLAPGRRLPLPRARGR